MKTRKKPITLNEQSKITKVLICLKALRRIMDAPHTTQTGEIVREALKGLGI